MDQTFPTVAIQGVAGSFHDEAAARHFGTGYLPVSCETFRDMFTALKSHKARYAVMAIENTVAGTILPNYALLRTSGMAVIGEVYLAIRQNLLALPGQKLEEIREVHSHPMAIQQCQVYFEKHPHIRLVETADTAASAEWIAGTGNTLSAPLPPNGRRQCTALQCSLRASRRTSAISPGSSC